MRNLRDRIAYRYLRARLLLSMSMEEAKRIFGFPPASNPTPQEISKTYRDLAFRNHPDRGGNPAKMVEINVAKDLLEGKGRPSKSRVPYEPPPRTKYEPPPPPPPVEGKSFTQAFSTVPGGVDWKFRSDVAYDRRQVEAKGGKVWRDFYGWVLYGQTESHHIFVGLWAEYNTGSRYDKNASVAWEVAHTTVPRHVDLLKIAPKMVREMVSKITQGARTVPKRFKVLDGTFGEKDLEVRAGLSLKDAIIGSGAMPTESVGLKGRKLVVTVEPKQTKESYQAYKDFLSQGGGKGNIHKAYVWTVEVNGRGRTLSEAEVDKLVANHFMLAVFSYDYSKGKKNISALRGGRLLAGAAYALKLLYEALHEGPLKEQVGQAAEQAAQPKK